MMPTSWICYDAGPARGGGECKSVNTEPRELSTWLESAATWRLCSLDESSRNRNEVALPLVLSNAPFSGAAHDPLQDSGKCAPQPCIDFCRSSKHDDRYIAYAGSRKFACETGLPRRPWRADDHGRHNGCIAG